MKTSVYEINRSRIGLWSMLLGLLLSFGTVANIRAADPVTLKGKITCGKCDLGVDSACATVIVVKEGGKDVVYYFDTAAHKKNHSAICKGGKDGTVTGTVEKKGDKNIVTVTSVKME